MIAGIHQPYFFPYLGYWQLIKAVDLFAIADNYNFIKGGWIHRNRVLCQGHVHYFNLCINHLSQNRLICDHEIRPFDVDEKLVFLRSCYHSAANLSQGLDVIREALTCDSLNLADVLFHSITVICAYLGIHTKIMRTSDYVQDSALCREDRIFDYCRQWGADTYYNAIVGKELYSQKQFAEHDLKLAFVECIPKPYPQESKEFIPYLSIVDIILNCSRDEACDMLADYKLITECD